MEAVRDLLLDWYDHRQHALPFFDNDKEFLDYVKMTDKIIYAIQDLLRREE